VQHCGMDLHSRLTAWHLIDGAGRELGSGVIRTTEEELGAFLRQQTKLTQVYLEASTSSAWAARVIEANGHRAVVVDPTRNRLISGSTKKTDKTDAATLATLGRANLLTPVHVRSPETDRVRKLFTLRQAMVRGRASLVKVVRATLRAEAVLLPQADTDAFAARMRTTWDIPAELAADVEPVVEAIAGITEQVLVAEEVIHTHAVENKELVRRLTSIPGVGELTAVAFLAHIEDPRRFRNSGQVAAYLGLAPWVHESAGRRREAGLTKRGNKVVRTLLIQAAWSHVHTRMDTALKRWFHSLAARVGRKKAIAALARKLGELMWTLWRKEAAYQPFPSSSRRAPTTA